MTISSALVAWSDLTVAAVIIVSNICVTVFHYIGSNFVFKNKLSGINTWRVIRYVSAVLLNWALNVACGLAIVKISGVEILGTLLAPVIPTIINFPVMKYFVFPKRN